MRLRETIIILIVCTLIATVYLTTIFSSASWKRPTPLINPIQVTSVNDGTITLSDGRTLIPAGISRSENITPEMFDQFLHTATAQGVLIEKILDNNRALITVEPKFYNWCGNSNNTWAGNYTVCDLSLLAIRTNYAQHDTSQTDLSPRTHWRLNGVKTLILDEYPLKMSSHTNAFRYEGLDAEMNDIDSAIEWGTNTTAPD